MKKSVQLLILIGIAATTILIMYFMSPPGTKHSTTKGGDNKTVKEFEAACDGMVMNNKWDKPKYDQMKEELELYRSKEVISGTDINSLENYLEVAYAKSMSGQCKSWQTSNGDDDITPLFEAMKKQASIAECGLFLNNDISIITDFHTAQGIPGRVSSFLEKEFDMNTYNSLISDINRCCNRTEIAHFSSLQNINATEQSRLNSFKSFADTYNLRKKYWQEDVTNPDNMRFFKRLCPDDPTSMIKNYQWYLYDMQTIPSFCGY